MTEREAALRTYFPRQPVRARPSKSQAPTAAGGRCPGAAAQLAAVHRTLRHGPTLRLRADGKTGSAVQRKLGFEFEQGKKPPAEEGEAQNQGQNHAFDLDADAQEGNEIEFVTGPLPDPAGAIEAVDDEAKAGPAPVKRESKPDGKP